MINKIITFLLYLVLATPLIYSDAFFFPFVTLRTLFFQGLILIIIILLCVQRFLKPTDETLKLNKGSVVLMLFLLSMTISSLFGVDPAKSFFGTHERWSGVFTFFVLLDYAFLLRQHIKNWTWYFLGFLLCSNIIALLGIAQYSGIFGDYFFGTAAFGKAWSVTGNYLYLGSYSIFGLFLSLYCIKKVESLWLKRFCITSFVLNLCSLFLAGSRGPMLAFLVGLGFLLIKHIITGTKRTKINALSIGIIIILFFGLSIMFRGTKAVNSVPGLSHFTDIKIAGTGETRLNAWKIAIEAWSKKPIIGWGQDSFTVLFNKFYTPETLKYGFYETNLDNPHSQHLSVLVSQGIIGFVLWLTMLTLTLHKFVKRREYVLGALVVACFVNEIFFFETLNTSLFLFMTFAYANYD